MTLKLVECAEKERWDRFTTESPQGSVFCLTPFLDALCADYRLLLVQDSGAPQAGLVVIVHDGQPFPGQYPLTIYQGVLLSHDLCYLPIDSRTQKTFEVLDFLLAALEERFDRLCLCLHHRFEDLRSFTQFHVDNQNRERFRIELQYSALLDLEQVADFDNYLRSIRHLRLREYRRCQASGFSIQPSRDLEMLERLHGLTFARQGIEREPQEARLLRSICRAALEKKFGDLLICVAPDGAVASATLFLFDRHCAYYLVGANDPRYRKTGSATTLMLENIRRAQSKGLTTVDFVGINSPNRGDFKTSFNAVPVPYFVATWERSQSAPFPRIDSASGRSGHATRPHQPFPRLSPRHG
jgi:hypothetical protein